MNSFLFLIVVCICIVDKPSIVSIFSHGSLENFFLSVVNRSCFCIAKFGSLITWAIYFKCCTSQNSDMGIVLVILCMSSSASTCTSPVNNFVLMESENINHDCAARHAGRNIHILFKRRKDMHAALLFGLKFKHFLIISNYSNTTMELTELTILKVGIQ